MYTVEYSEYARHKTGEGAGLFAVVLVGIVTLLVLLLR